MAREILKLSDAIPTPVGPYSNAVVASGRILFISGQVSLDANGELVGRADVRAQARQTFENVRRILEEAGGTIADLVKVTIFLKDVADLPAVSEVRREFYGEAGYPATSALQARLVNDEWLLEVEAVATLPE